jgi:hypothetical protein
VECRTALSYLFWGRQLFNLFVKHCFYALSLLRYGMIRPIEGHTITENQSNIGNKFVGTDVTRIGRSGVGFNRVRSEQFALDGRKVHRMLDDLKIMRYVQSLWVDGGAEGSGILHLFEGSYRR